MECMNTADAIFMWIGVGASVLLAALALAWSLGYVEFGITEAEHEDDAST